MVMKTPIDAKNEIAATNADFGLLNFCV